MRSRKTPQGPPAYTEWRNPGAPPDSDPTLMVRANTADIGEHWRRYYYNRKGQRVVEGWVMMWTPPKDTVLVKRGPSGEMIREKKINPGGRLFQLPPGRHPGVYTAKGYTLRMPNGQEAQETKRDEKKIT